MQSAHTIDQPVANETPVPTPCDIVEARIWLEEHAWLYGVLKSEGNVCPTFRFPDLISAAVTLSLGERNEHTHVFRFLGSKLVLRAPTTARRRESMWRAQYEQLQALQRLPANRHPNPNFQLDQITTACVALAREMDETGSRLLIQARLNMAKRASHGSPPQS
ncbi:MAG: hypothetical protein EKK45_03210 [Curvibacter sp.]|jgi:hypothetical protein|nr:MAG: hypothetical protein EKK45_03210 [Curvibacter sp.]